MTDRRAGERGGGTLRNLAILVVVAGLFALFLLHDPFEKNIRIGQIGADFFQRQRGTARSSSPATWTRRGCTSPRRSGPSS